MTHDERQAIVFSAFAAIRRLVPKAARAALEQHLAAATVAFNDQASAAYQSGMMAVEVRADRRDLGFIDDDTAALKSVH